MITVLNDLLQTVFPTYCLGCRRTVPQKTTLCLHCLIELPITNYHLSTFNPLLKLLNEITPVEAATSLVFFEKQGLVQQLIHQLKYMNKKQLGSVFGGLLGEKLLDSSFSTCDYVVTIPLHRRRERKRGYNQVTQFGQQLAKQLHIECIDRNLIRTKATKPLVRLNKQERVHQIKGAFSVVNPSFFIKKYILLIDDVVTTGATLSEAANCLLQIEGVDVSVATIAFAMSPLP